MKRKYFICLGLFLLLFVACKPTEKNYKSAYDAALGKRQAALAEIDVNLPEGAIQQVDGPQLKEVDGVKVFVQNQVIRPAEEGKSLPGSYNVAVGLFKMITNSQAQSQALQDEGLDAFPAKDPEGNCYTIAGSFPSLKEAVNFYQKYKSGKNRVYVGLPDSPVIIYSPR